MTRRTLEAMRSKYSLRPVGMGPAGTPLIYRSGEICAITEDEARALAGLGIRAIYDVRKGWEAARYPEPVILGVRHVTVMPPEPGETDRRRRRLSHGSMITLGPPGKEMLTSYCKMAESPRIFGSVIRSIAFSGEPALIHCTNGKDRAGVLAATILRIAGAPEREIMEDYLETNRVNAARNARDFAVMGEGMSPEEQEILHSFFEAWPEYLEAYFTAAEEAFGSFERFVEVGMGLGGWVWERLRGMCGGVTEETAAGLRLHAVSEVAGQYACSPECLAQTCL